MFESPRRRGVLQPQLTSLVDAVFLLVVFFMVSAEFGRLSVTPVASASPPETTGKAPQETAEHLREGIQAALVGGGMVNFNGMVTPLDQSYHMVRTLLSHMPRGVPPRARIYCRKKATVQELATLAETMTSAGLRDISVSSFPGE